MNRINRVCALIEVHGPSTADDLVPLMPGVSREQILTTLQWARTKGWLDIEHGKATGFGKGRPPGIYMLGKVVRPPERAVPKPIRVSSVWDLGRACVST